MWQTYHRHMTEEAKKWTRLLKRGSSTRFDEYLFIIRYTIDSLKLI